jgi:hypothetical protein
MVQHPLLKLGENLAAFSRIPQHAAYRYSHPTCLANPYAAQRAATAAAIAAYALKLLMRFNSPMNVSMLSGTSNSEAYNHNSAAARLDANPKIPTM